MIVQKTLSCGAVAALALFTSGLLPTSAVAQESTKEAYDTGRRAYYQGDYLTAKAKFMEVLDKAPNHYATKVLLKQVNMKLSSDEGRLLRSRLSLIVLKEIDLEEADLDAALEYLALVASKQSGGKFKPSFVVRGEKTGARKVTLKMGKIPLSEALRYIGEMADVNFHYEKFAVVATPMTTTPNAGKPVVPEKAVAGQPASAIPAGE